MITSSTPPQTPIILLSDDNKKVIAHGVILSSQNGSQTLEGIKISSRHAIILVIEVVIPGAILKIHKNRTLNDFGQVPFDVVCLRSHLRLGSTPLPKFQTVSSNSNASTVTQSSNTFTRNLLENEETEVSDSEALGVLIQSSLTAPGGYHQLRLRSTQQNMMRKVQT